MPRHSASPICGFHPAVPRRPLDDIGCALSSKRGWPAKDGEREEGTNEKEIGTGPGPPRCRHSYPGIVRAVALRVAWIYYTWSWPRTVIMSCAVVIADKVAPHSRFLPHTDAQRVICAALRETRRAAPRRAVPNCTALRESPAGYLAQVKSVQIVATSHDMLGLRTILSSDNGGHFHARKAVAAADSSGNQRKDLRSRICLLAIESIRKN